MQLAPNDDRFGHRLEQSYIWSTSPKVGAVYAGAKDLSFANLHASVIVPFSARSTETRSPTYPLKGLTLLGLSTHREKFPVTSPGFVGPKGFTYGRRTIAGTLGFTVLEDSPWSDLLREYNNWIGGGWKVYNTLPDELPPFDISLLFIDRRNPMDSASLLISGVTLIDSSKNISVSDIQFTDVYSFMAMDVTEIIDPLDEIKQEVVAAAKATIPVSSFLLAVDSVLVLGPSGTVESPTPFTETVTVDVSGAGGWAYIMTVNEGDELRVEADGSVMWLDDAAEEDYVYSLPEGGYSPDFPSSHDYDPGSVYWDPGASAGTYYSTNVPPFALAVYVVAAGGSPPGTDLANALRPNRDTTFTPQQLMAIGGTGPYDVYACCNDVDPSPKNIGAFSCTFTSISS